MVCFGPWPSGFEPKPTILCVCFARRVMSLERLTVQSSQHLCFLKSAHSTAADESVIPAWDAAAPMAQPISADSRAWRC